MSVQSRFPRGAASVALAAVVGLSIAPAQEIIRPDAAEGGFRLAPTDVAPLDSDESRDDLPCRVEPLDPKLEYDLTFQAGYVAYVPLDSLTGSGNRLRLLFRIRPLDGEGEPVFFRESFNVPKIKEDAEGDASLPGKYRLGPGRYEVDWLMRDRAERLCSHHWKIEAEGPGGLSELAVAPKAGVIEEFSDEPFLEEPPVRRNSGRLLHLRILASFSPVDPAKVGLNEYDSRAVVSMLRAISREPAIGTFSLVAFNAHAEKTLYEAENEPRIDFPALGDAVSETPSGVVDIEQLQDKKSGERYLQHLFEQYMTRGEDEPDAIVFVGPKVTFERNPSAHLLHSSEQTAVPVFSFIYNRNPRSYPWRDALSTALRPFSPVEYDITSPKGFGMALKEMTARLVRAGQPPDTE